MIENIADLKRRLWERRLELHKEYVKSKGEAKLRFEGALVELSECVGHLVEEFESSVRARRDELKKDLWHGNRGGLRDGRVRELKRILSSPEDETPEAKRKGGDDEFKKRHIEICYPSKKGEGVK